MNEDLIKYIKIYIFPLYDKNDRSHRLWHITGVIERSLSIAKDYDVNLDMVYTIAAFHDVGNHVSRDSHEIESAKLFLKDKKMKLFFDEDQIQIIKEAIEDHRASLTYEHRNIYGKIIATADKFLTIDDILKSVHLYTLENFPNINWEESLDRCYKYLNNKYGENGYASIPLAFPPYYNFLIEIRKLIKDKGKLNIALKQVDTNIKEDNME